MSDKRKIGDFVTIRGISYGGVPFEEGTAKLLRLLKEDYNRDYWKVEFENGDIVNRWVLKQEQTTLL